MEHELQNIEYQPIKHYRSLNKFRNSFYELNNNSELFLNEILFYLYLLTYAMKYLILRFSTMRSTMVDTFSVFSSWMSLLMTSS